MQDRRETSTISIPGLGISPLCPITALQHMFALIPASKNSPLFVIHKNGKIFQLSDSKARKHLKLVSSLFNTSPHLTFHSFRRSATTWAFHNGVSLQEIMKHGTWSSDAVWRYVKSFHLLLHKYLVLSSTICPFSLAFGGLILHILLFFLYKTIQNAIQFYNKPCIAFVKVESKLLALHMASLSLVSWALQKLKNFNIHCPGRVPNLGWVPALACDVI